MLEFLSAVFKHAPSEDVFVRWGPLKPAVFLTLAELKEVARPTSGDLYFGPALRSAPNATKNGVLGSSVAWLDYDAGEGAIPVSLLPPSITVSSGGPGRFHYYWLLNRFVTDIPLLEGANKALLAHHGEKVESGTWEGTRVLRVPGTTNSKYDPPAPVDVVDFHPERLYDVSDLALLQPYGAEVLHVPPGKSRSERDYRIARLLLEWGVSDWAIVESVMHFSDKAQAEGIRYVTRTIDAARRHMSEQSGGVVHDTEMGHPLSNFDVTSTGLLVAPDGRDEGLVLEVQWNGVVHRVAAHARDFESRRAVNALLESNGLASRSWSGSDKDSVKLWDDLVDQAPSTNFLAVSSAGRYDMLDGTRVFIYGKERAISWPDRAVPIFWLPRIETSQALNITPGTLTGDVYERIVSDVLQVNRPAVIYPSLGWTLATPVKTLIEAARVRFPLLLVFGLRGSGKTSLVRDVLMPLVGAVRPPLGADVTHFALVGGLTSTNASPLWIGEFRASVSGIEGLQSLFRMAYDGAREERGRPDLSVVSFNLTAPIVVDGETLWPDSALRERTLPIRLRQQDILGTDHTRAFTRLMQQGNVMPVLAYNYLQWTLAQDREELVEWLIEGVSLFGETFSQSRLVTNAAVAYLGMRMLREFMIDQGVDMIDMSTVAEAIMETTRNLVIPGLGVETPVERLVEIVARGYRAGQPWATASCEWEPEKNILWFSLTTVAHWVRAFWRDLPERDMLLPQIEERVGLYMIGPVRRPDGGLYYGIEVLKAQALGLDVPFPEARIEELPAIGTIHLLEDENE